MSVKIPLILTVPPSSSVKLTGFFIQILTLPPSSSVKLTGHLRSVNTLYALKYAFFVWHTLTNFLTKIVFFLWKCNVYTWIVITIKTNTITAIQNNQINLNIITNRYNSKMWWTGSKFFFKSRNKRSGPNNPHGLNSPLLP